jgi:hypothetical protein
MALIVQILNQVSLSELFYLPSVSLVVTIKEEAIEQVAIKRVAIERVAIARI